MVMAVLEVLNKPIRTGIIFFEKAHEIRTFFCGRLRLSIDNYVIFFCLSC
jgi:hypothetical protein